MRRSYLLLAAAALALAIPAGAKPAWLANAKKAIPDAKCTTCHVDMGKKDLNKVGEFAKAHMKGGEPDYEAVKKEIK